jgi:hypothetical protein
MRATTPVETASGTNAATMSAVFPTEAATIFAHSLATLSAVAEGYSGDQLIFETFGPMLASARRRRCPSWP